MTHPTDDELEAMAERFDRWHQYGYKMPSHIQADGDDAAAMLRACKNDRNASPTPDVRELEWRDSYGVWRAETPFGDYMVTGKIVKMPLTSRAEMVCEDTEAAKAAAQADYRARILSALATQEPRHE